MSSYAWVCFSCRTASRRSPVARNVRCQQCARLCECIGYKTAVPPKSKIREWKALAEAFYGSRRTYTFGQQKRRVRQIHDLEREIVRLESLPANEGRSDAVKHLRKQLERLRA
jgi:hypothetical protein